MLLEWLLVGALLFGGTPGQASTTSGRSTPAEESLFHDVGRAAEASGTAAYAHEFRLLASPGMPLLNADDMMAKWLKGAMVEGGRQSFCEDLRQAIGVRLSEEQKQFEGVKLEALFDLLTLGEGVKSRVQVGSWLSRRSQADAPLRILSLSDGEWSAESQTPSTAMILACAFAETGESVEIVGGDVVTPGAAFSPTWSMRGVRLNRIVLDNQRLTDYKGKKADVLIAKRTLCYCDASCAASCGGIVADRDGVLAFLVQVASVLNAENPRSVAVLSGGNIEGGREEAIVSVYTDAIERFNAQADVNFQAHLVMLADVAGPDLRARVLGAGALPEGVGIQLQGVILRHRQVQTEVGLSK